MSDKNKFSYIQLEDSWLKHLLPEFQKEYMKSLKYFLTSELKKNKTIFPKGSQMFLALNSTPYSKVKVVILGQDPYHGIGQAHGLCFSVPRGVEKPPSLVNIFKELNSDLGIKFPSHGSLLSWANQGVLLLNSVLSVEKGIPASHAGMGWEIFTDRIINLVNQKEGIVFILWGNYAIKKASKIDRSRHLVLTSAHPSPLSANKGFFGNKHFSKCNEFLQQTGKDSIDWKL